MFNLILVYCWWARHTGSTTPLNLDLPPICRRTYLIISQNPNIDPPLPLLMQVRVKEGPLFGRRRCHIREEWLINPMSSWVKSTMMEAKSSSLWSNWGCCRQKSSSDVTMQPESPSYIWHRWDRHLHLVLWLGLLSVSEPIFAAFFIIINWSYNISTQMGWCILLLSSSCVSVS